MDVLGSLPTELALEILKLLSASELATCRLVCRKWKWLTDSDHLWRQHFLNESVDLKHHRDSNCTWQKRYWEWRKSLKAWEMDKAEVLTLEENFKNMAVLGDGKVAVFLWEKYITAVSVETGKIEKKELPETCYLAGETREFLVLESGRNLWVFCQGKEGLLEEHEVLSPDEGFKCIAVLDDTICIYSESESSIRLHSLPRKKILASIPIMVKEPTFMGQNESLYVYNSSRILEINKYGQVTFSMNWEEEIRLPVELQSNHSVLLVQSHSPEEDMWISSKVVLCWERSSGRRLVRKLEKLHYLILDPSRPLALFVPKRHPALFTVMMMDLCDYSVLWETDLRLLSTSRFMVQLQPVQGRYLMGVIYKYMSRCSSFSTERFLLDLHSGHELYFKKHEDNSRMLWCSDFTAVFATTPTQPNNHVVKIMSYK